MRGLQTVWTFSTFKVWMNSDVCFLGGGFKTEISFFNFGWFQNKKDAIQEFTKTKRKCVIVGIVLNQIINVSFIFVYTPLCYSNLFDKIKMENSKVCSHCENIPVWKPRLRWIWWCRCGNTPTERAHRRPHKTRTHLIYLLFYLCIYTHIKNKDIFTMIINIDMFVQVK